jgi:histidinol phosphatase-like PHP family hydrolase
VNSTFIPEVISDKYDELWTEERMDKVIDAAVQNNIAIEINARYRIPSAAFIKRAKAAGAKFTMGTNNTDRNLGFLEYCMDMVDECGLEPSDFYRVEKKL